MKKVLVLLSFSLLLGVTSFAGGNENPANSTTYSSISGLTIHSLNSLNGLVSIDLSFETGSVCNQVQVMSIQGQVFYNHTFNTQTANVVFESEPGVYLIVCKNNNTVVKKTVLVK